MRDDDDDDALIENPEAFPAWVFRLDATDAARELRGLRAFEMLRDMGMRVHEVPADGGETMIQLPWTFIYMPVPWDDFTQARKGLDRAPCSVIMDCHFPAVDMSTAYVDGDPDGMFKMIESREVILNNLRLADAVTVPRADWAVDIAAYNATTFILPDLVHDNERALSKWIIKLNEVAVASANSRKRRPCTCSECEEKHNAEPAG